MSEYPSNSYNSDEREPSRIKREREERPQRKLRVVKARGVVVRRKKPLGARLLNVFLQGEDFRTAVVRVAADALAPAAKELMLDAIQEVGARMFYGENRPASRRSSSSGSTGHISYNSMSSSRRSERGGLSQRDRAMHNFDEILFDDEDDANDAVEMMWDILDEDEQVTVSDFYTIVGLPSDAQDENWGWKELNRTEVIGLRNGQYKIRMAKPIPLRKHR